MNQRVSPAAFRLMVDYESGGREYYEGHYKSGPHWPGGRSGVTIGFGYDLGYESKLNETWGAYISREDLAKLARCIGKTGGVAHSALSGVRGIVIPWDAANEVFNETILPNEIRKTLVTFPNAHRIMSANAFGALVSLVYNRGTDLQKSDRRREMREIASIVASAGGKSRDSIQKAIAEQINSMCRLWPDNEESDRDLNDRRKDEAKLVLTPDAVA